jgi:hypothetical protein
MDVPEYASREGRGRGRDDVQLEGSWVGIERSTNTREGGSGVEWSGVEWSGVEWSGVEWSGVEWSGVEWSGVE